MRDGDSFRAAAFHNAPLAFIEARKDRLIHPDPGSTLGQAAATRQVAQVLDSTKREAYRRRDPFVVAGADLGGYRTIVSVPMIKANELIGVVSIYRQEVRAFTDKQIDLVKSFASQARPFPGKKGWVKFEGGSLFRSSYHPCFRASYEIRPPVSPRGEEPEGPKIASVALNRP